MGCEMARALATDVDGTITESRDSYLLSLEAISAIRDLEEHGISVILVSGNSLPIVIALSRYLGTSGPVIAENGCVVYHRGRTYPIARESAKKLERELIDRFGLEPSWQNKYREYDIAFSLVEKSIGRELVERIEKFLEENYPEFKAIYSGYAIHVLPKDASKSRGLRKCCELIGVSPEDVVAIGDGMNDAELLETAGIGVAVGNADEDLKKIADIVLDEPSGRGFAKLARMMISGEI